MIRGARVAPPLTIGVTALLLTGWLVGHDPHDPSSLMPLCPFKLLTGWECPGCGGLRATWGLLHGDVSGALKDNALVVLALPIIVIGWAWWMLNAATGRPVEKVPRSAALAVLTLAITWTVSRNVISSW